MGRIRQKFYGRSLLRGGGDVLMTWLPESISTSTFSLCTVIVVVGLTGLCVLVKDVATLKDIALLILGAYGVKKGMEEKAKSNGNGGTHATPTPPAA